MTTTARDGDVLGQPPEIWTLVALYAVAVALCSFGALHPATPRSPTTLNGVLAVVGTAVAAAVWWSPARWRRLMTHVACTTYVAANGALIAAAATGEGAMSAAISYVWICLYAAVFLSRRAARRYALLAAGALACALVLNGNIISGLPAWMVVAVSLVCAVEAQAWMLQRLRVETMTDPLTGLLNRAGFEQAAGRERERASRTFSPLTLAVIDLDGFKQVNDRAGHAAGDLLLVRLTSGWTEQMRTDDVVARYGGDEFVLLMPDTTEGDARVLLERLRATSGLQWSYGVTEVRPVEPLDDAVMRADRLMYEYKYGRPSQASMTKPSGGQLPATAV